MSASVCPACGKPKELPRITPERLQMLCGNAVTRFAVMPSADGADLYVVAVQNVIHVITPEHFAFYQRLCANAADFAADFAAAA